MFAVRSYRGLDGSRPRAQPFTITYRNMKGFNESSFIDTLKETPWDIASIFDTVDDMLDTCESLLNNALDSHCPWQEKRVARDKQAPWMTNQVLQHLQKKARSSSSVHDWEIYRIVRNKATNSIKSAKFKFSNNCFEKEKGNSKGIWKIIKSLTGANNRKPNTVKNKDSTTADQFNSHFASVAERLRSLLPSIPFDMTKLVHFVLSRKDLEVEFSIPLLSKGYIIDNLRA